MSAKAIVEIARHELIILLRTKRAVAVSALYGIAALVGGLVYVMVVRSVEQQALQLMIDRGASPSEAASGLSVMGEQAYQSVLTFLAGTELDALAPSLLESPILPAFLWASLSFLPFLVLLTSFDSLSGDLQSRAVCYRILRAHRTEIVLGKVLAQIATYVTLTVVCSLGLVVMAASLLQTFSVTDTLPGLARLWLLLIPFGLCYLGVSTFASALTRNSFGALMLALSVLVGLRVFSWMRHVPETSSAGFLRWFQYLSPAQYENGFWMGGIADPATSAGAYLAFGTIFIAVAAWRLRGRDL